MRSSVVLPAPLRPSSATTSPRRTSTSTPCSTGRPPSATPTPCGARGAARPASAALGRLGSGRRDAGPCVSASARRVAHGERRRIPAEQAPEPGDAGRAGVVGEHGAGQRRRGGDAAAVDDDTTRSASGAARSSRCSASSTVVPRSALSRATAAKHVVGTLRIELRRGLVEHERDRAPPPSAPAIAQRWRSPPDSVAGLRSRRCAMPERVEHLLDPPAHRRVGQPEVLEHERDVALDVVDDELRLGVLVHEPDDVGELARLVAARRSTEHDDVAREAAAGRVGDEPVGGAQQRALARARRADDEQDLAGEHLEVDRVERERAVRVPERHPGVGDRAHEPATPPKVSDGRPPDRGRMVPASGSGSGRSSGSGMSSPIRLAASGARDPDQRSEQRDRAPARPAARTSATAAGWPSRRASHRRAKPSSPSDDRCDERGTGHRPVGRRHPAVAVAATVTRVSRREDRGEDEQQDARDAEADRGRAGATDERDERARERQQRTEPAPSGVQIAAGAGFEAEPAGVHRLRQRDRPFHAPFEHRHDAAQEPAAFDRPPAGARPVGLAYGTDGLDGRRARMRVRRS